MRYLLAAVLFATACSPAAAPLVGSPDLAEVPTACFPVGHGCMKDSQCCFGTCEGAGTIAGTNLPIVGACCLDADCVCGRADLPPCCGGLSCVDGHCH